MANTTRANTTRCTGTSASRRTGRWWRPGSCWVWRVQDGVGERTLRLWSETAGSRAAPYDYVAGCSGYGAGHGDASPLPRRTPASQQPERGCPVAGKTANAAASPGTCGAGLRGACAFGADFTGANFTNACRRGCILHNAMITGKTALTPAAGLPPDGGAEL